MSAGRDHVWRKNSTIDQARKRLLRLVRIHAGISKETLMMTNLGPISRETRESVVENLIADGTLSDLEGLLFLTQERIDEH